MKYLWLAAAIISEVIATSALKKSDGFTRLTPSILVVMGYGVAFYSLSQTLKTLPVGIAYAIWSGVGTVLIAVIGKFVYGQDLDRPAVVGMTLVLLGVIIINVFSRSAA